MGVRSLGLCRGDGKLYIKVKVTPAPEGQLAVAASIPGGKPVPAKAYPCGTNWVVEVPIVDAKSITLGFSGGCSLTVDYRAAKWESRLNYRLRKGLCAEIRDYERAFTQGQYQPQILRFLEGEHGIVWRIKVAWTGPASARPRLQAYDGKGNSISHDEWFFEFQEGAEDEANNLFLSVGLPADQRFFILEATDPSGQVEPGFCSINNGAYEAFKYASWKYMKDARADGEAYRFWFEAHRAKEPELQQQRESHFEYEPLISVVVAQPLPELKDSLKAQTYGKWELAETAAEATGDYVAFAEPGAVLEPDALYRFVQAINENEQPVLLYCDEDMFEQPSNYVEPAFKTPLNLDLLYSGNCIGYLMLAARELLTGLYAEELASPALNYDVALRATETDKPVVHVPHMLYHAPLHDEPAGAEEAGRQALQQHFDRRGIAGIVETTQRPFVYRMHYALPEPSPLVSIVIPSKDHADVLDACVQSILQKATYPNYEIIVVENNSTDSATFAYYEQLQAVHENVHVVTWSGQGFNYSAIINYGAQQANGEYLLLLNNDTEVITPNFIEEMLGYLQRPEVGVVGAKLYFRDGLTQHAGMQMNVRGAVAHVNQDFPPSREGYLGRAVRPGNFSGVTGACQLVRRSTFEEVGGYEEQLAVGFNDADFCLRVAATGKLITFTPYAELHHYEFVSRGREEADPAKQQRWEQELAFFKNRHAAIFEQGDPFTNPNLSCNSAYYALPAQD